MNQTPSISVVNDSRILFISIMTILSCLGLSGCATTPTEPPAPSPTQKALIGKTQQELMSCVGITPEVKIVDEVTVLKYYKEASILEESSFVSKSSFPRVHHGCWATLALKNDRVEGIQYNSVPSSYKDEDHCDEIFENCLGK
jgi:hypothetical protein